jgi:hypothetical protein
MDARVAGKPGLSTGAQDLFIGIICMKMRSPKRQPKLKDPFRCRGAKRGAWPLQVTRRLR